MRCTTMACERACRCPAECWLRYSNGVFGRAAVSVAATCKVGCIWPCRASINSTTVVSLVHAVRHYRGYCGTTLSLKIVPQYQSSTNAAGDRTYGKSGPVPGIAEVAAAPPMSRCHWAKLT
jgi:hypothetical protein